jgi:hypothetical protein
MKHYKSLRLSLLASILVISSIYATETVMKKAFEATEIKCGDPCQGKIIFKFSQSVKELCIN